MPKEKSIQIDYLSAINELLNQLFYFDSAQNRIIEQQVQKLTADKQKGVLEILEQAKNEQDKLLTKLISQDKNFAQQLTAAITKHTKKIKGLYEAKSASDADQILNQL